MIKYIPQNLDTITKILVFLATASLIIRIGIIKPYTLQPFELFILIAAMLFMIQRYQQGISAEDRVFFKFYGKIFTITSILFVFGTLLASLQFGITKSNVISIIKDGYFFFTVFCGFVLCAYYGTEKKFRIQVLWTMSLSVIFSLFLIAPHLAQKIGMLGNSNSLIGLQGNPSILGSYLLIPFTLFIHYTFTTLQSKKYMFWILGILTFSLILWTGSRGAWLAVAGILATYIWMHIKMNFSSTSNTFRIIIIGFYLIGSGIISFLILPQTVKVMALDRIFPQITNYNPSPAVLEKNNLSVQSVINSITVPPINTGPGNIKSWAKAPAYQDRQNLWPQAVKTLIHHPFGIGLDYGAMSKTIIGPDGNETLAHNTFLQVGLIGGIVFLVLFVIAVIYLFKRLYKTILDSERSLLLSLSVGFLITMLFNDYLFTLPWLWVIAGIILGKTKSYLFIARS